MRSKVNTGFHAPSAIKHEAHNDMDRLSLLLDGRRIVDSEHAALRSRRRQAQSVSTYSRRKHITLPVVSILNKPET